MAKKRASTFEMIVSVVVVCAVAAAGLALTYSVTKDRIAEQDRLAREKALKAAIPGAVTFEALGPAAVSTAQQAAGDVHRLQRLQSECRRRDHRLWSRSRTSGIRRSDPDGCGIG